MGAHDRKVGLLHALATAAAARQICGEFLFSTGQPIGAQNAENDQPDSLLLCQMFTDY